MNKYILKGKTVIRARSLLDWSSWFQSADRIVKQTNITPEITVSTTFLGIDHQFGDGPPLVFETMVFGGNQDQDQWRYSTYDQAIAGHEKVVAKLLQAKENNEQVS